MQYNLDGSTDVYPADLVNPVALNTWYVASIKIAPDGAAYVAVWPKDSPSQRREYQMTMTAGLAYRFQFALNSGTAWIDNYQEQSYQVMTFAYDGDGARVKKTEQVNTTIMGRL